MNVNFTLENFEDQDEISSEVSAFQREEVELAKPFLIWHLTSQGLGPTPVGLYQPSVLERLLPLHSLGTVALRHSRAG